MRKLLIGICALLIGGVLAINEAEAAKRMGGGRNTGAQRSVTNTPPAAVPAKPGQQAAPASGFAKWAPLLGGLAIGGLLGSMFGGAFGDMGGLGSILMIAMLAMAAVFAFRYFMGRRAQGAPQTMQFAGTNERVTVPPSIQPGAPMGASAGVAGTALPAGFDAEGFVRAAKMNFVKLQVANDAGNLEEIREFTTAELFDELSKDVRERGGFAQQTDIVTVNAELLEVVTDAGKHWASVRFSGLEREAPGAEPVAFQEVWNLSKPADGSSGWLLAGIQQMQ